MYGTWFVNGRDVMDDTLVNCRIVSIFHVCFPRMNSVSRLVAPCIVRSQSSLFV